ncbi:MAG: divergent polysaccharide deacetylase family protein, partial [bacterium]
MTRRAWLWAVLAVLAAAALGWFLGRNGRPGPGVSIVPATAKALSGTSPVVASVATLSSLQKEGKARLAIVLDDWGYLRVPVERLKDLHFPLTTSILPGLPYSRASAEASHALGDCVILHCPMQSVKSIRRERYTLMAGMDPIQARGMLQAEWNSVPWLCGLNNHEGSKASA